MLTEVQRQLVTAYEELAISRAAANSVMAALANVCAEYGIDETTLCAVNERARRAVIQLLPAVAGSLTDGAKQAITPVVEKQDEPDTRTPRPARRSARSVS